MSKSSSWLLVKNGDSPAEIILATAILMGSLASSLPEVIAGLLNIFMSSKRR